MSERDESEGEDWPRIPPEDAEDRVEELRARLREVVSRWYFEQKIEFGERSTKVESEEEGRRLLSSTLAPLEDEVEMVIAAWKDEMRKAYPDLQDDGPAA